MNNVRSFHLVLSEFSGVRWIAWIVLLSNAALVCLGYGFSNAFPSRWVESALPLLSVTAVFPYDVVKDILPSETTLHLFWIGLMMACGWGMIRRNYWARIVFLTMNGVHIVVLGVWLFFRVNRWELIETFFRFYITLVASGSYIGFLTLPEIRQEFRPGRIEERFRRWWDELTLRRLTPKDAGGLFRLGMAYHRLGRDEEAIRSLQKAVDLDPDADLYVYQLGVLFFHQKNWDAAIHALKKALQRNPVRREAYFYLGRAYQQEGCHREAADVLAKAGRFPNAEANVFYWLALSQNECGERDKALESLEQARTKGSRDRNVFLLMAEILSEDGEKPEKAWPVIQELAARFPNDVDVQWLKGGTALRLKKPKEAVRAFKEVLRHREDDIQGHYQLGLAYAQLRDWESVRRQCAWLEDRDPDCAHALALLLPAALSGND